MRIEPLKLMMPNTKPFEEAAAPVETDDKSFGKIFSDALGEVNQLQNDSQKASLDLATGKLQDVSQVVIAAEKAGIALQLTMQVRNKVVEAYQEVMRMQV